MCLPYLNSQYCEILKKSCSLSHYSDSLHLSTANASFTQIKKDHAIPWYRAFNSLLLQVYKNIETHWLNQSLHAFHVLVNSLHYFDLSLKIMVSLNAIASSWIFLSFWLNRPFQSMRQHPAYCLRLMHPHTSFGLLGADTEV